MMAGAVPKSMKSVSFSIRRVNRLRRAAERTRIVPVADRDLSPLGGPSNGWIASACNPNDLVGVFDTLWLKVGFALHAYEYREGSNGNGIIWAVPADAPLVAPDECARLVDTWLAPPRAAGSRAAHASNGGRRQSLVVLVGIGPVPRGSGIRGNLAWLRLERPDDSLQAPAAGRRPGCVARAAGTDQRRTCR